MSSFLKLADHCEKIGSGSTPNGGHRSYVANGIPLIRSQNVLMRSFTREGLARITLGTHEGMAGTEIQPNDVLLNITGASIGRVCVVPDDVCPANVNQHVCIIRCSKRIDPHFLMYHLSSPAFQKLIDDTQAGGTRQALTKSDIGNFEIPALAIEDQRKICNQFRRSFDAITRARRATSVQAAEVKSFAASVIAESLAATVPRSLGNVLDEVKNGIGSDWRNYSVMGATRQGLAAARERPGKTPERYKPVTAGTVFYNPMRILIGSIAFVDDDDEPGITSPDYVVLKGKPGVVDSRWFYYWLRSPLGERCIQSLARGAVRERMLFNRLAEGEIELPSYDVQVKASKALAQIKPMRAAIQKQIAELELLPQKLLAQVFDK
jgi:type I restriction enzyme S subunit